MKNLIALTLLGLSLSACAPQKDHDDHTPCTDEITGQVGVIIGDSIAEGHPALHGRHHGQCENLPGQTSFYLEEHFQVRVLNQGIGGQTCAEIMDRWGADVDAHDTQFVWLSCGQNDLVRENDPVNSIKAGISEAIQKAQDGGYSIYIQNLAYVPGRGADRAKIDAVNSWLETVASPNVVIVDFHGWASGNMNLIPDGVHPSKSGYEAFALNFLNDL